MGMPCNIRMRLENENEMAKAKHSSWNNTYFLALYFGALAGYKYMYVKYCNEAIFGCPLLQNTDTKLRQPQITLKIELVQ